MQKILFPVLFVALSAVSSGSALASPPVPAPFDLEVTEVNGSGCVLADVTVERAVNGIYFIKAEFQKDPTRNNAFLAEAGISRYSDFQNCTIDFDLRLKPGYKLDSAAFNADGLYHLSEKGTSTLALRFGIPGVGLPDWVTRTAKYSTDPSDGVLLVGGSSPVYDPSINYCGATIPFEYQIHGAVSRGFHDSNPTNLQVTNADTTGTSASLVQVVGCQVQVTPCGP